MNNLQLIVVDLSHKGWFVLEQSVMIVDAPAQSRCQVQRTEHFLGSKPARRLYYMSRLDECTLMGL